MWRLPGRARRRWEQQSASASQRSCWTPARSSTCATTCSESTPLGWACRWGRVELVTLLLERGADSVEADAEPWATPLAWAEKMKHGRVVALLHKHAQHSIGDRAAIVCQPASREEGPLVRAGPRTQASVGTLCRRRRTSAATPPPMPIRSMLAGSGTGLMPIPRADATCMSVRPGSVTANI